MPSILNKSKKKKRNKNKGQPRAETEAGTPPSQQQQKEGVNQENESGSVSDGTSSQKATKATAAPLILKNGAVEDKSSSDDQHPLRADDSELDRKHVPHTDHKSLLRDMSNFRFHKFADNEIANGELVYELDSDEERRAFQEFKALGKDKDVMKETSEFWQLACLRARKFEGERALELLENFVAWKEKYGVEEHRAYMDEFVREYLKLGVFISPGNKDKSGRYMMTIRVGNQGEELPTPREILVNTYFGIEYLLVRFPDVQARGLVVCHDMKGARLAQFDSRVPRESMAAMSKCFPLRFGGSYVVNAPWFMRLIFPIVRTFMSKKMRERMKMLGTGYSKLPKYIDVDQILPDMGGTYPHGDIGAFASSVEELHQNVHDFIDAFKVPAPGAAEKMLTYTDFLEARKASTPSPQQLQEDGEVGVLV